MRNCGVSSSIQSRCKAVGAEIHSSLVKRQLKNIQDRNDYHMTRTNSIKYKERQAVLRCARFSDQEIIMEKLHKTAVNFSTNGFTSGLY
jgi:hypothetical protein